MIRAVRLTLLVLLALATALPVRAAIFNVSKTADTLDGVCDADCSLREAVSAANSTEEADVVVVPAGIYALTRTGAGEEFNVTGDLDVERELILVGADAGSTILDGFGSDRVLDVRARAEVFGVTIRNGRVDGDGGGILVQRLGLSVGDLLLHRSVVSGNRAQNGEDGGGISSQSRAEVRESAILDNQAEGDGGGISAGDQGTFSLSNVTVSGNLAHGSGGGLDYRVEKGVTISGSTIALNQAHVSGGGISARMPLLPGAFAPQLAGSIVAINTAPVDTDCAGASSHGYNVVDAPGSCILAPTDRTKLPNQVQAVTDSRFSSLGPTPVHVLTDGSPALDLVPAAFCEPADQVGQARSSPCDAGAWEKVVEHPDCVPGGSTLCLQGGRFRVSARWKTNPDLPGEFAPAVPLTDDTGNFWFFAPDNLEVMVKVLNGCGFNQRWWVFASGLTDVGVDLEVWDLETGRIWFDHHDQGQTYPPRLDTDAFPCDAPAPPFAAAPLDPVTLPAAAVLLVTKTADTLDGSCDHDCSLREAVAAANAADGTNVIVAGPGIYTLTRQGREEDHAATGDLDVTDDLLLLGAGADRTVLDGGGIDRVLDAHHGLELHGATVRNGLAAGSSFFSRTGGGIFAFESLSLVRSQVTANRADLGGGGIYAIHEMRVRDSTISGNSAAEGGGIYGGFDLDLENVTVSGNQAVERGGGIYLDLDLTVLAHVTITGNSASEGGGVFVAPLSCPTLCPQVSLHLERTVIAGNTAGMTPDCGGTLLYVGSHNVVGVREGCGLAIGAVRQGTLSNPLDPGLGPLGFHGGPTPTHAPLPGSPVLDLAPCPAGRDQRGRPRPDQTLCDAGSVERLPGACQPDEDTLCLGENDRFEVTVEWTALGETSSGKAVPLTLETGAFWFFDAANLELTVKVLDGCGTNDRYWVFLSGLTDVGVEVTVRDTKTGETWTHSHAAGKPFQPRLDTNALEVCP